jgi:hypothetical protein
MKNKLLLEELKRFNKIISYDPKNPLAEGVEDEVTNVERIVEKIKPYLPISKQNNKFLGSSLIQAILVDSGYCVYGGKCDYIDGDFGTTTEKSLKDFIGKNSLDVEDTDILKSSMLDPNKKGELLKTEKTYVGTIDKFNEKSVEKQEELKKKGFNLEGLTDEFKEYFLNWWKHDKKLDVSGDDLKNDILKYITKKEGGITDTTTDTASKGKYMPHKYDTKTRILTYDGKQHKLSGENLPKPTKSKIYDNSYSSDRWHTNRGAIWKYYIDKKGGDTLENAKKWLNFSDEDVYNYYIDNYFSDKFSDNDLVNHFLGLVTWGSGPGGRNKLVSNIKSYFENYGGDIDKAIKTIGLPAVFDVLISMRLEQFIGYNQPKNTGGWVNSLLNFYYYFKDKYIKPIADEVSDDLSMDLINMDSKEIKDNLG